MTKNYKKGDDYKFYLNTGTQSVPVWSLLKCVKDLQFDPAKADIVIEENGASDGHLHGYGDPLFSATIFEDAGDANCADIYDAADAGDMIEIALANGPIATTGTKFYRLESCVTGSPLSANKGEAASRAMEFRRHANSDFDLIKSVAA